MKSYLLSRFMIGILSLTVASQIVGTFFVLEIPFEKTIFFSFFFLWLSFLFFMRVVDDTIDKEHDNIYYKNRSVQQGQLDLKILMRASLFILCSISIYFWLKYGIWATTYIFLAISNTFLGFIWFWFWKNFRFQHIIIYHILNSIGLSIIQILLYSLLINEIHSYPIVVLHFTMIFLNNFLIEVVRKIKHSDEISHHDDYISLLGERQNNWLILSLISVIIFITIVIFSIGWSLWNIWLISYMLFWTLLIFRYVLYSRTRSKDNKNIVILGTLLFYLGSNCIYYFL